MEKYDFKHTAVALSELRSNRGLSQERFAEAISEQFNIDISSQSVKNYESKRDLAFSSRQNNASGMNIEKLFYICKFFGVSADYILGLNRNRSIDENAKSAKMYTQLSGRTIECLHGMDLGERLCLDEFIPIPSVRYMLYCLYGDKYICSRAKAKITMGEGGDSKIRSSCKNQHGELKKDIYERELRKAKRDIGFNKFQFIELCNEMYDTITEYSEIVNTIDKELLLVQKELNDEQEARLSVFLSKQSENGEENE